MKINDALFLETLLMKIRSETITYSIRKRRERFKNENRILSDLQILESFPNPSDEDMKNIAYKQSELQTVREVENEGRIVRSRARWYEEGERSSSYFFSLEKRNFESKLIPCLDMDGRQLRSTDEIIDGLSNHFENLFKKQDKFTESELMHYLDKIECPKLTKNETEFLDKDITVEELGETLKKLQNNRSPGSDGFPYEFYKVFWGEIKYFVYKSLMFGLSKGSLSVSQREGLITLVPKPLKPRNLISSWRPITLLNSTYKIFSAAIANRLKQVLNSIIHEDQAAFLKTRFIGESTRLIYDVLWETRNNDQEGLLLSVDFKSAFDVMSWRFLEACLLKFNFGPIFIKIFRCLHNDCISRITYNGHASKRNINLERGCRQGDPVSCYFFIIGAEILANIIRQSSTIRGIQIRSTSVKITQYADDTTFFLDGTEECLRNVFNELGWFAKFSGLKPNVSKCHAMWIGRKAYEESRICPEIELQWVTKVKLLGIVFNPLCLNITEENIQLKKEAILRIIGTWQTRNLTLAGKIVIVKSLLLSQITHILASLPSPRQETMKEIKNIFFNFVWGARRNPIKRMRLCQSIPENGLGMIDIESFIKSLKIKWVKRIVLGKNSTWLSLIPTKVGENFIWNYGVTALKKQLEMVFNPFWREVIIAWISFSTAFRMDDYLLCYENIFNSDITKFKKNRYASWERKGVKFIGDLYENNKLMSWQQFKNKFNIYCVPLEYQGLLHSLPFSLKKEQPSGWYQQPAIPARIQCLLKSKTFTTYFAKSLVENNARAQEDMIRIENKWISDIGNFEKLSVQNIRKAASASRYISFQFKLTMRILTTNVFLSIIRVQDDDKCSFCRTEPETLKHLFLTCSLVDSFWCEVSQYISRNGLGQINDKTKIFGHAEITIVTHCVTVAKYVIYEARRKKEVPNFIHFRAWLSRDLSTEEYIAHKNGTMEELRKKWGTLYTDLRPTVRGRLAGVRPDPVSFFSK